MEQEKSQGHKTQPLVSLPPGAKDITVTQDRSQSCVAEVGDEYLFGRAKTGSLGLETT